MLLRPSMLDDLGLTPALAWLIKEVSRSSGIEIKSDIDPSLDALPDTYRTCLYRVVQEALTNASRHSSAARIDLTLRTDGKWVQGAISDNGMGFDISAMRGRGLGLLGMEERVRELGGSLRIASNPGRGTRVEINLPYPESPEVEIDTDTDRGRSRDRANRVEASA
jgi:signal transduction histidine kinase